MITGSTKIQVDQIIFGSSKILASGDDDYKTWQGPTFSGSGLFAQSAEGSDSTLGLLNVGAAANTDIDLTASFTDGTYGSFSNVGGQRNFDIGVSGYDGSAWKSGGLIQLQMLGPVSGGHTAARTDIVIFPKNTGGTGDSFKFTPTGLEFSDGSGNDITLSVEATDRFLIENDTRIDGDLTVEDRLYLDTTATYLEEVSHSYDGVSSDDYIRAVKNIVVGSAGVGTLEAGLLKSTFNGASYMRLRYGSSGGSNTDIFLRISGGKIQGSTDGSSWNDLW